MDERSEAGDSSGPGADGELIRAWTALGRGVSAAQHSLSVRAEQAGISAPFVPVLLLLLEADDHRMPMSRIAKDLAMTSGGFTKLADRMARDGLIDRRGSSGDRRVVFAALTDKGEAVGRQAGDIYAEFLREAVLVAVSDAELRSMAAFGERLRAANEPADADVAFPLGARSPDAPERRGSDAD
jgi:DNA-binding MarR family transcriptional regulator